jgi:polyisoprenoid-binding protein YceI
MTTTHAIAAGTWTIDVARAEAAFVARQLGGLNTVDGTIAVTSGTLEIDATGSPVRLAACLDPAAIDTGNPRRDKDLRGRRFLDVAAFGTMEVVASEFVRTADGWRTDAVLRVRGREVTLRLDARTPDGTPSAQRLRVTGTARLDRRTIGIRVPGFMVGRYVDIAVSAQLTRP